VGVAVVARDVCTQPVDKRVVLRLSGKLERPTAATLAATIRELGKLDALTAAEKCFKCKSQQRRGKTDAFCSNTCERAWRNAAKPIELCLFCKLKPRWTLHTARDGRSDDFCSVSHGREFLANDPEFRAAYEALETKRGGEYIEAFPPPKVT
jgi:hypothetical protein